jgi:hypothetical protein
VRGSARRFAHHHGFASAHGSFVRRPEQKHEGQCNFYSCDIPARFECFVASWQYGSVDVSKSNFQRKVPLAQDRNLQLRGT